MIKHLGLNHKSRTTAIVLLGAILILLASASAVLATQVTFIKEHHPASTFQLSGADAYRPGTNVTFHLHLNVSSSSPPGANLDITNLTITDILPPGLTYVPNSQISEPTAAPGFSIVGQTLMWNWSSAVLSSGAAPPLPGMPANLGYTASVAFNVTIDSSIPDMTTKVNNAFASYKEVLTQTPSNPSTTDTIIITRPVLSILKTGPVKVENGSSFNYTVQLTNTGSANASGVVVTDNLPAGVTHSPPALATSGSFSTDTASQVVWTGNINAGSGVNLTIPVTVNTAAGQVVNFANYTTIGDAQLSGSAFSSFTTTVIHPSLTLTKTPSATKVENGTSVTYTYTVTNTGDTPLTVSLTDNVFASPIFTGKVLAPGASNVTTVNHVLTANTTNVATATGVDQTGKSVSATASATVQVIRPAITLTKTPSATKVENGTSVTYTYTVTNTGDTPLTVSLTDNVFASPIFTGKVLAAGASNVTTVSHTLTANTTNTATATGVDQTGASVSATATATVRVVHPALTLTKTPSATKVENGTSVTYTYTVTNTGDIPLTVSLTDNVFASPIFTGKVLAPGASNVTTVSHILTANTTNVATATGVDQAAVSVSATATATVRVLHPAIALTKTASPTTPQIAPANFTFTYNVTNIGDVALSNVRVFDQTFNALVLGPVALAVGQSAIGTLNHTYAAAGNYTNFANATGTDQTGANVTAFANATVVVIPPPSLATRTIGFWQTHTNFTEWVFDNKLNSIIRIDSNSIHNKNITTYGQLFGAFYASIPKNTDGTQRPAIDQARMILLQQLVGAILNHAASGVVVPIDPVTGKDLITAGNLAYSSNNSTEMLRISGLLDSFNGSGDGISFPPGTPDQGNATPQTSKSIANLAFWNSPL